MSDTDERDALIKKWHTEKYHAVHDPEKLIKVTVNGTTVDFEIDDDEMQKVTSYFAAVIQEEMLFSDTGLVVELTEAGVKITDFNCDVERIFPLEQCLGLIPEDYPEATKQLVQEVRAALDKFHKNAYALAVEKGWA